MSYFNFVNRIVLSLDVNLEADSGTGYKVKGTTAPINLPINTVVPANATTSFDLVGNLDSGTISGAVNQVTMTTTAFTDGGAAVAGTLLNDLYLKKRT